METLVLNVIDLVLFVKILHLIVPKFVNQIIIVMSVILLVYVHLVNQEDF